MSETATPLVLEERVVPGPPSRSRVRRGGVVIAAAVAIVLLALAAYVTWDGDDEEAPGLVFTIPYGSYQKVAVPGIDSAIDLPTEITFTKEEVAAITIVNEDVVQHRAGPFLVGPGQTYTQRFPAPGEYFIDCSVDASESIAVIVEGGTES